MKPTIQKILATVVSAVFLGSQQFATAVIQPSPAELVDKSYLDLLNLAPTIRLSAQQAEAFRKQIAREREFEKKRLEREAGQLKKQIEQGRRQLAALNKKGSRDTEEMTGERRDLHCHILRLERQLHQKQMELQRGLPVAYDNKVAKLDLVQQWPARQQEIQQTLASGRAPERRYGDAEDIGVRKISEGQEKDVKTGQDAIREMKAYGMVPPELEDKDIKAYVQRIADTVAANSDLTVPVRLTILQSVEVNAFALPGGFLFVNTGLIGKADNESELVGVIAHELAHAAARHGPRLMKRAAIANIIYSAAQVAAVIFTGGAVGIGTYYALQYGFYGLGMAMNLTLLGVSREFESEADQLGVQYAWRAGYDPRGFITFFDKMASEKGYVKSASFFRTHPAFFERIVSTFSEIEYLPKKENLRVDSTEFQQAKQRLKLALEDSKKDEKKHPTLRRLPECPDGEGQSDPTGEAPETSSLRPCLTVPNAYRAAP